MDLKARIAQEKSLLEKVQASLSDEDREEIALREQLAELRATREKEELAKREMELERRLDKAREADPEGTFEGVLPAGFPDAFIVMRSGKAHANWYQEITKAVSNKNADRQAINRRYACAVVYDWNGIDNFDNNSEGSAKLNRYLTENPGLVTPITDAAAKLAGVFLEERKS